MKPLIIFQHAAGEGPGYLSAVLRRRGVPFVILRVDRGAPLPASAADYAGLVFMGGPMSVNDPLPWIPQALSLIRQAQDANLPVLGHCLGGQLISKALGGTVTRNPVPEIGWGEVTTVANSVSQQWLGALPPAFEVFHWHGETFSLPRGASHILSSHFCHNQGFVLGRILALQCHIEMTATMVDAWIDSPDGQQIVAAPSVQTAIVMRADISRHLDDLHRVADALYDVWLDQLCG
ncbi:MAG: type 1 glutamine amidotransferase [Acidiferrobacter sp.]